MKNARNVLLFIGVTLLLLLGCHNKKPIKIGFVGSLTGRNSNLGIAERNAVLLAVEQINEAGGIHGRPVELIVEDDEHNPEVAVQADKKLIEEGVVAIIGHATSSMSIAVLPFINQQKVLMISPTASTNALSYRDDYFFRIMPPSKIATESLAEYIFRKRGIQTVVCVYDLANAAYTQGWFRDFKTLFGEMGGGDVSGIAFNSEEILSYWELVKRVLHEESEGIIILAGPIDTAMISQQIRKIDLDIPLFTSGWAYTVALIQHGGSAVEDMMLSHTFSLDSRHESFLRFYQQFQERFTTQPGFAETFGYEAAMVLFEVLKETDNGSELKDVLLARRIFPGLQGNIEFDQYGDNRRPPFLITIQDGRFSILEP